MADEPQVTDANQAQVSLEVQSADPPNPSSGVAEGAPPPIAASGSLDSVIDVPLRVTVQIGAAKMLVREVLQLNKGSVIPLDRMSGDPADILVNGRLIARGEVTVVDESLAVRVIELIGRDAERAR